MHHLSHQIITPPRLAAAGSGFAFVAQFRVNMRLDPGSPWTRFQYRQYIKGNSTFTRGRFNGSPHSRANWVAAGLPSSANAYFQVPGGLTGHYTEDGQVSNGVTTRFGYRSSSPVHGLGIEDRYLPSQSSGRIYQSLDTCGIRGTSREVGLRITYHLFYEGRIIDTQNGNRTVLSRRWEIRADDIIG